MKVPGVIIASPRGEIIINILIKTPTIPAEITLSPVTLSLMILELLSDPFNDEIAIVNLQ